MRNYIIILLLMLCIVSVSGCAKKVANHGFVDHEKVAQVQKGKDTKDAVFYLLGSPSASSILEKDSWYYISERQEGVAFLNPELKDQEVTVITFDNRGIVEDITHYGMEDRKEVAIATDKTKTVTRDMSVVQQLLGNLGRFNNEHRDIMEHQPSM